MNYTSISIFVWAFRIFAISWVILSGIALASTANGTAKEKSGRFKNIPVWIRDFADTLGIVSFVGAIYLGFFGAILALGSIFGFLYQKVQYCTPNTSFVSRANWFAIFFARACIFVTAFDFAMYAVFRMLPDMLAL